MWLFESVSLFDEQRDFIREEFALGFDTLAPTTTIQPTRAETIQVVLQTEKSVSAGIIPKFRVLSCCDDVLTSLAC